MTFFLKEGACSQGLRLTPTTDANRDPKAKIGYTQYFAYQNHGSTEDPNIAPILGSSFIATQICIIVR